VAEEKLELAEKTYRVGLDALDRRGRKHAETDSW